MKVALVIDFLMQKGGAERTLEVLHSLFPDAPVYTLSYSPEKTWDSLKKANIISSPLIKKLPLLKNHWRKYLVLYPFAIEQFDFSKFDLVISLSFLFAKGIITPTKTCHICYCLTPMRQAWDMYFEYLKREKVFTPFKQLSRIVLHYLRLWDEKTSSRPDYYLTISENVARRIEKRYRRQSEVIYPPVDTNFFCPADFDSRADSKEKGEFFLVVSRLVPYKRVDLAIEAFNELQLPLKIVGTGREEKKLKKIAKRNIEFLGELSKEELLKTYQNSKALIFPQEEDFGIVALEAQSCGKPVIAFESGSAKEIIKEGQTGIFFKEQTVDDLIESVRQYEKIVFSTDKIRSNAEKFGIETFKEKFLNTINKKYTEFKNK